MTQDNQKYQNIQKISDNPRAQEIQKIAILGAGTMGAAIAQYFAARGYKVNLYSRTEGTLQKAADSIRENTAMLCEGAGTGMDDFPDESAERAIDRTMDNVRFFTSIEKAVAEADWVIESVSENREIKKNVIEEADRYAPECAYLTSDTSALNIYEFLSVSRPDKLMITHFFNPACLMPLVEMVPGLHTSDETIQTLRAFLEAAGKAPILLKECIPGFIANRLTLALAREAFYLAGEGYASIEDIDRVITTTFGPRYIFEGIFDLYDHIGMDVGCTVAQGLLPELCSDTAVPRLLQELTDQGKLGVKNGQGLKDYHDQNAAQICKERNRRIAEALKFAKTL